MTQESININSHNHKMVGTIFRPKQDLELLPAIIFFHGRGSKQERYYPRAEAVCQKGVVVLIFSFRGCGKSEGQFDELTTQDGIDDALAGYDFLINQKSIDKDKIGIYGGSYGGYLASIISSNRHVKALALDAPAIYKDEWMHLPYSKIPIDKIKRFNYDKVPESIAYKSIANYRGRLLVIEHEKDEIIPKLIVKSYFDKAGTTRKKYQILKNAPHRLVDDFYNQDTQIVSSWFAENLQR